MRTCRECGITEDVVDFFTRTRRLNDGTKVRRTENICMLCRRDYVAQKSREYWERNKEARIASTRQWKESNRRKYNRSQREWYRKKRLRERTNHGLYVQNALVL